MTPTERAVCVLREVFDTPYADIADVVGKSAGAVRQPAIGRASMSQRAGR